MKIQGKDAAMAGGAIDAEQVFQWAQEYYYTPDAKPTDFKAEAGRKAEAAKREAERKKSDTDKKAKSARKEAKKADIKAETGAANTDAKQSPVSSQYEDEDKNAKQRMEQFSLFGSGQDAEPDAA